MNSIFQFKQFTVEQKYASMKVGTDGVLLGAWAQVENTNTILDIGTGTGLIALMIAQRNPAAKITAIEVDQDACLDTIANFENSRWKSNLKLVCEDLKNYQPTDEFDLIVSNPPFFKNSLHSPGNKRNKARHDVHLTPEYIFSFSSEFLSSKGNICVIYPADRLEELNLNAEAAGLHLNSCCFVKPTPAKEAHRVLLQYNRQSVDSVYYSELIIEDSGRHKYSANYKELTKEFYLAF